MAIPFTLCTTLTFSSTLARSRRRGHKASVASTVQQLHVCMYMCVYLRTCACIRCSQCVEVRIICMREYLYVYTVFVYVATIENFRGSQKPESCPLALLSPLVAHLHVLENAPVFVVFAGGCWCLAWWTQPEEPCLTSWMTSTASGKRVTEKVTNEKRAGEYLPQVSPVAVTVAACWRRTGKVNALGNRSGCVLSMMLW